MSPAGSSMPCGHSSGLRTLTTHRQVPIVSTSRPVTSTNPTPTLHSPTSRNSILARCGPLPANGSWRSSLLVVCPLSATHLLLFSTVAVTTVIGRLAVLCRIPMTRRMLRHPVLRAQSRVSPISLQRSDIARPARRLNARGCEPDSWAVQSGDEVDTRRALNRLSL